MSDEQLDAILGTTSTQYERYQVIHIDNGSDIAGTGATGDFITKKFNKEEGKVEKTPFAKSFEGVILANKAQVVDKGQSPSWRTNEFDATKKEELVKVYPLREGNVIKDANGRTAYEEMTYEDIKTKNTIVKPGGKKESTYNFFIILYVGLDTGEVVKLKFKGVGRGNFFDYSKEVRDSGATMHNIITKFSTYVDKQWGKHTIKFESVLNAKGFPTVHAIIFK